MGKVITVINIMLTMWTRKSDILPNGWILGLAVLLLILGVPALCARVLELPGDSIRFAMLEGQNVSPEEMDALEASRRRVVSFYPTNANLNDLALIALTRGNQAEGERAKAFFAESEKWQRQALAKTPADPYGWFRLAYLFLMEDGPVSARTAAAWAQSMAVAPYEPLLMIPRLHMGMSNYALMTAEAKSYIPLLVRGASIFDAEGLARIAKAGNFVEIVRDALAGNPDELRDFEQQIKE